MTETSEPHVVGAAAAAAGAVTPATVAELADRAGWLGRSSAQVLLEQAEALHAAYRVALTIPERFARGRGLSRSEASDLVERSIRAELAVGVGVSERVVTRLLEQAQLLVEHLPRTRAAVAAGQLLWEACEAICAAAGSLPESCRGALDERAAEAALSMTPTQLRRVVGRWRDELHEEPLVERHARARELRAVWVTPEKDGMATLCAVLPAPVAMGAFGRVDRIARMLRDGTGPDGTGPGGAGPDGAGPDGAGPDGAGPGGAGPDGAGPDGAGPDGVDSGGAGDERTLAQLRADALASLLCDGDIAGTTPAGDGPAVVPTFVPGVRAEVRLTLAASTAAGLDDAPADLDGYGSVPAVVARELVAVGASFTRVLTDPDTGTVTSVGRTYRVPPARMRLHLQLRDQTCRFPGCTRPASTSEADHTIEWRNGGHTALENMSSLCTGHHHVRHGDRWTYVLHPDGSAKWTTPTGRLVTTRPPALPGRPPALSGRPPEPPPRPRFDDTPPPF